MYLAATGMVCSVGLSAPAACAAMRAGIAGFNELPYHDLRGEPVVGAPVPGLAADFEAEERVVQLLSRAIADCLSNVPYEPLNRVPLLVCLAEQGRPGGNSGLSRSIKLQVERQLGLQFHSDLSHAIAAGHTAGFEAVRNARELFENGHASACLICAVDSYIVADSLLWLEKHWRLKSPDNSDGAIPGEAGVAILVRSQPAAGNSTAIKVVGLGFARETASVLSEEPLLGVGLAEAARGALKEASIPMPEIAFRLSDVTGEQYGFKEQGLALARLLKIHLDELPIWHCADAIGDTGAAAGLCQFVIGYHAFVHGYAPGDRALCFASAVPGARAAAVLATAVKPGRTRGES